MSKSDIDNMKFWCSESALQRCELILMYQLCSGQNQHNHCNTPISFVLSRIASFMKENQHACFVLSGMMLGELTASVVVSILEGYFESVQKLVSK